MRKYADSHGYVEQVQRRMLVIGASVDTEEPTEGLDIVLETELMDSI